MRWEVRQFHQSFAGKLLRVCNEIVGRLPDYELQKIINQIEAHQ